jgi:nucleotide-binding universal stress UspA family protein
MIPGAGRATLWGTHRRDPSMALPDPAAHPPPSPSPLVRTVLVGIDGSPSSAGALDLAQALAARLEATLVLVHACDTALPFASDPTIATRRELLRHGQQVLHEARTRVVAPLDQVTEELEEGRARDVLVAAAQRHAPALLVVGSRGLGGLAGLLLGSTSRWLVEHAPCPVLVSRGPAES